MAPSSTPRRIVVLGQKDAMRRALWELAQLQRSHGLEVMALTPRQPKRLGANDEGVQPLCENFGFRHVQNATDDDVYRELADFKPDLVVSILWPRRIKDEVLALCEDCINFHPSLLPKHRGSLTQFWAIFEGDTEAGATCHRMVHDFDAGRILHQVVVKMATDETALSLNLKIATAIEQSFQHVMQLYFRPEGLSQGNLWDVKQFPYHFRQFPQGGVIDPTWSDNKVERFIRAMYFPPHQPAVAIGPDGEKYPVTSLEQYHDLLNGTFVGPSAGTWHPSSSSTSTGRSGGSAGATSTDSTPHGAKSSQSWSPRLRSLLGAAMVVGGAVLARWVLEMASRTDSARDRGLDVSSHDPNLATRYTLSGHSRARCLDGTPASYYIAPAKAGGTGQTKWLIYFQGGGWCAEAPELTRVRGYSHNEVVGHPELCSERAGTYHGSSSDDLETRRLSGRGYLSGDAPENPTMHDWHRVIVRNCDGTAFLGSLDEPIKVSDSISLHFRGRDNALATIDALLEQHGLADATEVVISGCSAGGVAAVVLADQLRARIREGSRASEDPFVAGLADSGVFPVWPKPAPQGVLAFPQFEWIYSHANASGSAPARCLASGLEWRCLHVSAALPFVETPVFIVQSDRDSWHVMNASDQSALVVLASRIRQDVVQAIRGPHGGAIDACFHHCQEWGKIQWGGQSNAAAFGRWYSARRGDWARNHSAPPKAYSVGEEGWPLVHDAQGWVESCYPQQEGHRSWHMRLPRYGTANASNGRAPPNKVPPPPR